MTKVYLSTVPHIPGNSMYKEENRHPFLLCVEEATCVDEQCTNEQFNGLIKFNKSNKYKGSYIDKMYKRINITKKGTYIFVVKGT